ncbi:MAG: hypothetical protein KH897_14680 [Bacteroides sp.]|uniref:NVEALA domain-containing protein n=1 Tax=Bacteroides sp. TaxID=29523 RepID=UPI0025BB51EC|nr:NVEALA domain-containing protein [Bacteroides sp.]MBS6239570.1 hypothetical protein [Bacteroides sp.]
MKKKLFFLKVLNTLLVFMNFVFLFYIWKNKNSNTNDMKRIALFSSITLIVIATILISKKVSASTTSDLMLANIEALANPESGGTALNCWQTINGTGASLPTHVTYCLSCSPELARSWSGSSSCMSK